MIGVNKMISTSNITLRVGKKALFEDAKILLDEAVVNANISKIRNFDI